MKRPAIILLHLGYWFLYILLVFSFLLLTLRGHGTMPGLWGMWQVWLLSGVGIFCFVPGVLGFYSFYSLLFTRFLQTKKFLLLLLFGILATLSAGVIALLVLSLPATPWNTHPREWQEMMWMLLFLALLACVHGIIGLVMKGFICWYGDIRIKEELTQKNHETELALVKSQLNPHFLFNTIHNIDVLIEKDAAQASLYLNKLSDIMRFMLYETKTEQIPLSKELAYIEKYIALQKIRTANMNYVQYSVAGDAANLMIEPLLFIPYIENAFKHATHERTANAIRIQLSIEAGQLVFDCENRYSLAPHPIEGANGLGHTLLQKRLALLYPNKHTLAISRQNGIYKVNLILHTHEN